MESKEAIFGKLLSLPTGMDKRTSVPMKMATDSTIKRNASAEIGIVMSSTDIMMWFTTTETGRFAQQKVLIASAGSTI